MICSNCGHKHDMWIGEDNPRYGTCSNCTSSEQMALYNTLYENYIDAKIDAGREFDVRIKRLKDRFINKRCKELHDKLNEFSNNE